MIASIILFAGIINIILGIIILLGKRSVNERGLVIFGVLTVVTFLWSFCSFLIYKIDSEFFPRMAYSLAILVPTLFLLWVYAFTSGENEISVAIKIKCVAIGMAGVVLSILNLVTNLIIVGFTRDEFGIYQEITGSLYFLYFAFSAMAILIILIKLFKEYRINSDIKRKQIKLVLIGLFLYSFFVILFDFILPSLGYMKLIDFDVPSSVIFVIFIAYAIIRYQLFNIKLIAAQVLTAVSWIIIGSQFFFIEVLINKILTGVVLAITVVFGMMLIHSIKKEIEQEEALEIANKKIQADKEVVENTNVELVKLDQAKTEFLNIASHQLRTPISVIQGVASMMLEGDMEKMTQEQKQKFYQSVWDKSKKLKNIVHDILNASSFASRKYSVMDQLAESINVAELLEKIIKDFEIETTERGLDLSLSCEKNMPEMRGQKEYLEEAFINLINNAIKYTPSVKMTADVRGVREDGCRASVEVSLQKDPANPKNILVEVKDNGIGIPEEAKVKLFQRFSRAKNAVDMYTDGTGLGLFIIKEVVEGHGGRVWFESEIDKGTTFFVSLPIKPVGEIDIKAHITQNSVTNPTN